MKKPGDKQDGKYRTITVRTDIYEEMDKLRVKEQAAMGLAELSWSNFAAILVGRLKAQKK